MGTQILACFSHKLGVASKLRAQKAGGTHGFLEELLGKASPCRKRILAQEGRRALSAIN